MSASTYRVSRFADGRDAVEILTASSHDAAADLAHTSYGMIPMEGHLWVNLNGDIRHVEVEVDLYEEAVNELTLI